MGINKSIFRAANKAHADAIVAGLQAVNFPSRKASYTSTLYTGVSEFSVVVLLDADVDGWLSDLQGINEIVSETQPPVEKPYWVCVVNEKHRMVNVQAIGPHTRAKAEDTCNRQADIHGEARLFEDPLLAAIHAKNRILKLV